MAAETRRALALAILLIAGVLGAYGEAARHQFLNFDDDIYVSRNPFVMRGLSRDGISWAFTTTHGGHWHPLTWVSLMATTQIHGPNPGAFAMTNVVMHAANAVLLFVLLRRMTGALWRSWLVAALFALHPLRVESVAWIVERKDVQSGFFFLLALLAYHGYVHRPRWSLAAAVASALVLGLLTKPMLVTLPLVLLLLDGWPLRRLSRESLPRLVLEKAPLVVIVALSAAATLFGQRSVGALRSLDPVFWGQRVANAAVSYVSYLGMTLWPVELAAFYPLVPIGAAATLCSVVLLAALTLAALRAWRRSPGVSVGWLWYLVTLVPVIGLVHVGAQALADRFTYIPSMGLLVAVVFGVADLAGERVPRRIVAVACMVVLTACFFRTRRQVGYWYSSETLFARALEVTSENYLAHNNLGLALEGNGRTVEARRHYEEAIRIDPGYPEARNNLGALLARQGELAAAIPQFEAALARRPDFPEARKNLALALSKLRRSLR